jgi:hypothetical protein
MKPFELFEPTRSSASGRGTPVVRVLSGGRLSLNAAATRFLDGATFVQLLWDEANRTAGILPTHENDTAAFRVTHAPSQAVITSKSFVETNSLPLSQRMTIAFDGSMLTFAVPETGSLT